MQKKLLPLAALLLLTTDGFCHYTSAQAQSRMSLVYHSRKTTKGEMKTMPLACNLAAMTVEQRQHYGEIKIRLRSAAQEVKELPDGYAFRYAPDPALLMTAAEFTTLESRCCPFFSFTLEVQKNGGPMWLRITGPKAAKPFIKEALTC